MKLFRRCERAHKENCIHFHYVLQRPRETNISKPGQIKTEISAWLDAISGERENTSFRVLGDPLNKNPMSLKRKNL